MEPSQRIDIPDVVTGTDQREFFIDARGNYARFFKFCEEHDWRDAYLPCAHRDHANGTRWPLHIFYLVAGLGPVNPAGETETVDILEFGSKNTLIAEENKATGRWEWVKYVRADLQKKPEAGGVRA